MRDSGDPRVIAGELERARARAEALLAPLSDEQLMWQVSPSPLVWDFAHIGHFHTGGVPGRHELDGTQELNYRPIAEAIVKLGFDGYMAHEFIPVRDPLKSLAEAVDLCDV